MIHVIHIQINLHRILDINVIYIENAVLPWTNVLTLDIKVVTTYIDVQYPIPSGVLTHPL